MHLLSKRQLAEYIGVCEATVDRWRHQGKLPFLKPNGKVLFDKDAVDAALQRFHVRARRAA